MRPAWPGFWAVALLLVAAWLLGVAPGCGSAPKESPSPGLERTLQRGQALVDGHQYEEATNVLMQALVEAEAEDDLFGQTVCYLSLCLCQMRLGNTDAAARMLAEAERVLPHLVTEQPNVKPDEMNLLAGRYHEVSAELAKAAGNWAKAAEHLDAAERHYQSVSGRG